MATVMANSSVDEIVQLTDKLGMDQEEEWEVNEEQASEFGDKSLVRRIVSKQSFSVGLFRTIFTRMWKALREWKVKIMEEDKENIYFGLSFQRRGDAKKVLEKQPWLFNGGFLILEEWPTSGQWRDARLDKVSLWVKMRGFPLKTLTMNNVKRLGNMTGEVQDIIWNNPQQIFLNGYVRVRTGFPIMGEVFVGRFIPVDGGKRCVQIKFDKLPLLCFNCGVWGHDQATCTKALAMETSVNGDQVPKYGVWLKDDDHIPNCFVAHVHRRAKQQEERLMAGVEVLTEEVVRRPKVSRMDVRDTNKGMASMTGQLEKEAVTSVDRGKEVIASVEGDTLVEMVDTGRFMLGYGREVQGDGHHSKESRKRVSIKNKARAKAKMGGSQAGCLVPEKKKMEAGAVGLSEAGFVDGNEGDRVCDTNSEVQDLSSSPGHILATVAGSGFSPWFFTRFYGNPEACQRRFSWQLLRDLRKEVQGPWLYIRDFKEIASF
ncbi:hypothetical protein F8388_012529 [Cannabis sativa]|uniref:DUF4283 domain-containing protein n=1 Tax=Cannabis sativa TaxID=3483 RepID=A0A7J6H006_CANSA|nr:hypothetical protein F8388_012529 [Cannabis sativa]